MVFLFGNSNRKFERVISSEQINMGSILRSKNTPIILLLLSPKSHRLFGVPKPRSGKNDVVLHFCKAKCKIESPTGVKQKNEGLEFQGFRLFYCLLGKCENGEIGYISGILSRISDVKIKITIEKRERRWYNNLADLK